MKIQTLLVLVVLVLASSAFGQSYDMTIHLSGGGTVTIAHDEILRIEFANIVSAVDDLTDPGITPSAFKLLGNYPNPFNPMTTIEYEIPAVSDVHVRIFDLKGALVRELLNETQSAGLHQVVWNGTNSNNARVSSGVYLYVVQCGGQALSRQLILVK